MTDTIARLRVGSKIFETMVDLDKAMKIKKGEKVDITEAVSDNAVWTDLKRGMKAGNQDLMEAFQTTDFNSIVKRIIERGNIEVTKDYRDEETEKRKKQIIEFLVKNAVDARTNRPFTPDAIESVIKQAGIKIENQPVDKQISSILEKIRTVIPIKIETKKLLMRIPAQHTGRVYGIVQEYKEKENWLANGELEIVLNLPIGLQNDFYDKLNSITHGSAITQEIKEKV
jgi:ribosome maturation protein SDO1